MYSYKNIAQILEYSYYYHLGEKVPDLSTDFFQPVSVSYAIACNTTPSWNRCSLAAPMSHCWHSHPHTSSRSPPTTWLKHMPCLAGSLHTVHTTNAAAASLGTAACHPLKWTNLYQLARSNYVCISSQFCSMIPS